MANPIELLWATPLMRVQTDTHALAADLRTLILSCENDAFRKTNSPQRQHRGVFESDFDFLTWQDKSVQQLREVMFGYLGSLVKLVNNMNDEDLNSLRFDNHCWFHITRSGGYFQPHNHANASWSMVYCVDPGKPDDESASGCITFLDPRTMNSYQDPANSNMRREANFSAIRHQFQTAEIAVFPSYLYHYVDPYFGESPRITVAANFWFRREA